MFYTRTTRVFGERLNEALAPFELLPITLYAEVDPEWEEYTDMYEAKGVSLIGLAIISPFFIFGSCDKGSANRTKYKTKAV